MHKREANSPTYSFFFFKASSVGRCRSFHTEHIEKGDFHTGWIYQTCISSSSHILWSKIQKI